MLAKLEMQKLEMRMGMQNVKFMQDGNLRVHRVHLKAVHS